VAVVALAQHAGPVTLQQTLSGRGSLRAELAPKRWLPSSGRRFQAVLFERKDSGLDEGPCWSAGQNNSRRWLAPLARKRTRRAVRPVPGRMTRWHGANGFPTARSEIFQARPIDVGAQRPISSFTCSVERCPKKVTVGPPMPQVERRSGPAHRPTINGKSAAV